MRKPRGKIANPSKAAQLRRKLSTRKTVIGSAERPRLCTVRTNKHLFVQVIDDNAGKTIASVATFGKNAVEAQCNVEGAKKVGAKVGEILKEKGITTAVFDRNGRQYHGVIAAVADSVREQGIQL